MQEETIYIKNMVCPRCIRAVREDLAALGAKVGQVSLGSADIAYPDGGISKRQIALALTKAGFELMEDEEQRLVERVKINVLKLIESGEEIQLTNSRFIEESCGERYDRLSRLFSAQESITIEQYIIQQKIWKVKEWLRYDELPLKEIAHRLGYSSVAYLSAQFKQVTGQTISDFRADQVFQK